MPLHLTAAAAIADVFVWATATLAPARIHSASKHARRR